MVITPSGCPSFAAEPSSTPPGCESIFRPGTGGRADLPPATFSALLRSVSEVPGLLLTPGEFLLLVEAELTPEVLQESSRGQAATGIKPIALTCIPAGAEIEAHDGI